MKKTTTKKKQKKKKQTYTTTFWNRWRFQVNRKVVLEFPFLDSFNLKQKILKNNKNSAVHILKKTSRLCFFASMCDIYLFVNSKTDQPVLK